MSGVDKRIEEERAYRRHLDALAISRLRTAALFVIAIFPIDGVIEYLYRPESFGVTFHVRIMSVIVALAVFLLSGTRYAANLLLAMIYGIGITVAVDIEMAIISTGGFSSPFYAGHILVMLVASLFIPLSFRHILFATALIWAIYVVPLMVMKIPFDRQPAIINLFFLFAGTLIALLAAITVSDIRRREFFANRRLELEKEKSERLLLNILPLSIAERLKNNEQEIAGRFDSATVLFADVVGFTGLSEKLKPDRLVTLLNRIFSGFDNLAEKYRLEKIKTIGDAYMVAGGVPEPREDHAEAVADMALDMLEFIKKVSQEEGIPLQVRIGINSGPIVAGVIGKKKFSYDLWGDTVNMASRMESHGINGKIQVTEAVYERLKAKFVIKPRGVVHIKGKGTMETWLLTDRRQCYIGGKQNGG